MISNTRYLIQTSRGQTLLFYIRSCADIYAAIHNTNVVEINLDVVEEQQHK